MVDVILPVLDEAAALPWVLSRIPAGYRAIVVDNGSSDGSPEIAEALGAVVVAEPRRGFGAACFAGLMAASAEVVSFLDADGSLDPDELAGVVAPVLAGDADLVLGRRVVRDSHDAWPLHARLGNRWIARSVNRRSGLRLRDLGPMRCARRDALLGLGVEDRRFGWPLEMVLRAAAAGWRVEEVPVAYFARTGRSKVTGTVRGTACTVSDMLGVLRDSARTVARSQGQPPPAVAR